MTPSERIKAMLAYLGINAKKFSAHLGYERPQLLYDIINDRTKRITELLATRIVSAYPQFNRVWLITGEGEMLKDEAASESISQVQSGSNNTQINGDNSGNTNSDAHTQSLIDEIAEHRRLLESSLEKSQKQIDRLLSIIENITDGRRTED